MGFTLHTKIHLSRNKATKMYSKKFSYNSFKTSFLGWDFIFLLNPHYTPMFSSMDIKEKIKKNKNTRPKERDGEIP